MVDKVVVLTLIKAVYVPPASPNPAEFCAACSINNGCNSVIGHLVEVGKGEHLPWEKIIISTNDKYYASVSCLPQALQLFEIIKHTSNCVGKRGNYVKCYDHSKNNNLDFILGKLIPLLTGHGNIDKTQIQTEMIFKGGDGDV